MTKEQQFTDKEMLDWMDKQTGTYTGKVMWRWSIRSRGWRLHETSRPGAVTTVREAITNAMLKGQNGY